MSFIHNFFLILFVYCLGLNPALSDVVKPALVEINIHSNGSVDIEIRASIEALLTGINAQYKNTKDAPTADDYDVLRAMPPDELEKQFTAFHQAMLDNLNLSTEAGKIALTITSITIPEPGYTKVPRISVIELNGQILTSAQKLQWYYPARFGDNAVRVRQIDEANDQWHWSEWQWLRKDQASEWFSLQEVFAKRSLMVVIGSYITVGFEHIIPQRR